ncbi:uncharacterized protein LOC107760365 isoform X2 [Nicotiana tabacum]|uniref:Uncharacterized protein LOC107760365 isoform X2 n=1 Tax=Nicotiana tabacum TaxID=4097 RepID=A0A1S3X1T9_TOBAC|nr:PREDICTED: uncharacterized protein LOC107760365 isoform X2 [Nicotiana tabacum]
MSSTKLGSGHNSRNAKKESHDVSSCMDSELHECEKYNSHEFISVLESELKVLSSESVDILKLCGENQLIEEFYSQTYSDDAAKLDQQLKGYNSSSYSYKDRPLDMFQSVVGDGSQKTPVKTDTVGFMDFNYYNRCFDPGHTEKACSELDSQWTGIEKAEPWWRAADKELAASGSLESAGCIGNSVLSWPQFLEGESYNCSQCCGQVSVTEKEFLDARDCYSGQRPSQSQYKRLCVGKGCSTHGSRQTESDDNLSTAKVPSDETQPRSSDLNKAQLLEALCHSQTRAREAEQLAQQAYNEKEHVIKLFFRQASHLFAYRQWLQILQLEALCLQLRNKDEQNSTNFSPFLPLVPIKGRKLKKCRCKPIKRKPAKDKCKINMSAVAFALGLSLAGAGLLLGWTMGWLFPAL